MDQVAQTQIEPSSLPLLSLGLISKFNSHACHLNFWNRSTIWSLLISLTGTIFVPQASSLQLSHGQFSTSHSKGLCKSDHALSSAVKLINVFQWLRTNTSGSFPHVFPSAMKALSQLLMAWLYLTIQVSTQGFHLLKRRIFLNVFFPPSP